MRRSKVFRHASAAADTPGVRPLVEQVKVLYSLVYCTVPLWRDVGSYGVGGSYGTSLYDDHVLAGGQCIQWACRGADLCFRGRVKSGGGRGRGRGRPSVAPAAG